MEQVKLTWKDLVKDFFGNNEVEEEVYENIMDSQLLETMKKMDEMGEKINGAIHVEGNKKTSKNGGFSNGLKRQINPNTYSKMQKLHDKIKEERESNDRI